MHKASVPHSSMRNKHCRRQKAFHTKIATALHPLVAVVWSVESIVVWSVVESICTVESRPLIEAWIVVEPSPVARSISPPTLWVLLLRVPRQLPRHRLAHRRSTRRVACVCRASILLLLLRGFLLGGVVLFPGFVVGCAHLIHDRTRVQRSNGQASDGGRAPSATTDARKALHTLVQLLEDCDDWAQEGGHDHRDHGHDRHQLKHVREDVLRQSTLDVGKH
mmetsp:Transcript_53799/g.109669  ORF Transcript_53799/g.109669 Transcript_53799/m.109669 type:complete len:221 (+) Transcript_53799:65-727(+)